MADQPSPRRRFQFRLRTLFVVVTFAGITAGILKGIGPPIVVHTVSSSTFSSSRREMNWDALSALTVEAVAIFVVIRAIRHSAAQS
jgi:hypothetical protein